MCAITPARLSAMGPLTHARWCYIKPCKRKMNQRTFALHNVRSDKTCHVPPLERSVVLEPRICIRYNIFTTFSPVQKIFPQLPIT